MYKLKKEITPGCVVWGNRNIYYDDPNENMTGKKSMYVITMINEDYFFGCPLSINKSSRNLTELNCKWYPIKKNSRITECLYRLKEDDIVSPVCFKVSQDTFEYFKRRLYKRIIRNQCDGIEEYNVLYVNNYMEENRPSIGNLAVYREEDNSLHNFYIYDETDTDYITVPVSQERVGLDYIHTIIEPIPVKISKNERYYDYYPTNSLTREEVLLELSKVQKQKTIGTYPKK